jgi:hypothetical protein
VDAEHGGVRNSWTQSCSRPLININVFFLFKLLLNENNRLLNAAVSELVAFVEELLL